MCPLSGSPAAKDSIGPAIEDDVAVFITQQRGVRSRGFTGAYLSGQEMRISRYHERIDDYIDGTSVRHRAGMSDMSDADDRRHFRM